jgi:hypothetical protein
VERELLKNVNELFARLGPVRARLEEARKIKKELEGKTC